MIDLEKLKAQIEPAKSKKYEVFYPSKVKPSPDGTFIRLMPPQPSFNGLFYYPIQTYFYNVGGTVMKFISPRSINPKSNCPIQEELERALRKYPHDIKIQERVKAIQKREEFLTNIIVLDSNSLKISEPYTEVMIFSYGNSIRKALTELIMQKHFDGANIADFEKGWHILISKMTNKGSYKVDYTIIPSKQVDITSWAPSYVLDRDMHPDILAYVKSRVNHPEYYKNMIRHILYEEPIHPNLYKATYDDYKNNVDISDLYDKDLLTPIEEPIDTNLKTKQKQTTPIITQEDDNDFEIPNINFNR